MATRTLQFLAVVLTAIALIPSGAHLLALAAKMELPEEPYFVAQQIYRGWAWLGIIIVAAVLLNFVSATLAHGRPRQLSLVAGLLIATTLAIFFTWTHPANQETLNWTYVPSDWEQLRLQWEYSHAVNAALTFVALLCSVGALSTHAHQAESAHVTAGHQMSPGRRS
jgi:xanthine/uracil permease